MRLRQKEIVLLPYPFSDLEGRKVRPALIVSNEKFNKKSDDCVMVPLTSVLKKENYSVVDNEDMVSGRLIKKSRVRVDKIFCVKKSLVSMKIGMLDDKIFKKVKAKIMRVF